jgi:hypothetical protein
VVGATTAADEVRIPLAPKHIGAQPSDEPVVARPTVERHMRQDGLDGVAAVPAADDDGTQPQQVGDDRLVGSPAEGRAERPDSGRAARRLVGGDPAAAGTRHQRGREIADD